jgi:predicted RNA-binding Zn-ribbon protein involved in translation (DUF1610 family)
MTSAKQKRERIRQRRARREVKKDKRIAKELVTHHMAVEARAVKGKAGLKQPQSLAPVNYDLLAPRRSYGTPDFVARGYYEDRPFTCRDCGKKEVWRATQQKWWYETAKGDWDTTAVRCRQCRRKERERKAQARASTERGLARKSKSRRV